MGKLKLKVVTKLKVAKPGAMCERGKRDACKNIRKCTEKPQDEKAQGETYK